MPVMKTAFLVFLEEDMLSKYNKRDLVLSEDLSYH